MHNKNYKLYHSAPIRQLLFLLMGYIILYSCTNGKSSEEKGAVLLADREAPLGWVYLKIYEDNSFTFISRGLRGETIFEGTVNTRNDSLFFIYNDSVPPVGKTAVISSGRVNYIDGEYPESIEIKLNILGK